jgi:UPF0271 protein
MKTRLYIIDTSAILSGKPINLESIQLLTTPGVLQEFKPGGQDYRNFQLLRERGLTIRSPSQESLTIVNTSAQQTGDHNRLSPADREILALALDINKDATKEAVILTDDYSIQNVADALRVQFQGFSQKKITQKFKWICQCPGCKKQFKESIKTCPICGKTTKLVVQHKENLEIDSDII